MKESKVAEEEVRRKKKQDKIDRKIRMKLKNRRKKNGKLRT